MENNRPYIIVKAGPGNFVPQYLVEYDEDARELIVDGVRVSTELFRDMIVAPRADCWLRFERKDDLVMVHQYRIAPGEEEDAPPSAIYYDPSKVEG